MLETACTHDKVQPSFEFLRHCMRQDRVHSRCLRGYDECRCTLVRKFGVDALIQINSISHVVSMLCISKNNGAAEERCWPLTRVPQPRAHHSMRPCLFQASSDRAIRGTLVPNDLIILSAISDGTRILARNRTVVARSLFAFSRSC